MTKKISCFIMTNFHALDTFIIYSNISKTRLLIQITLCRNASIQMDISRTVSQQRNNKLSSLALRKERSYQYVKSSRFFSSPLLPIFSLELKIIAYRGSFTIPSWSKLELLCQCEMISWYYIVTKSSIVDDLWV